MINLINMNVEDPSNVPYRRLQIDDAILKMKYKFQSITT